MAWHERPRENLRPVATARRRLPSVHGLAGGITWLTLVGAVFAGDTLARIAAGC